MGMADAADLDWGAAERTGGARCALLAAPREQAVAMEGVLALELRDRACALCHHLEWCAA